MGGKLLGTMMECREGRMWRMVGRDVWVVLDGSPVDV